MHLEVGPRIIIRFSNGIFITETVFWAVIVAVCMIIFALVATRNLKQYPRGVQLVCEIIVGFVYNFVKKTMGKHCVNYAPFIGSLFFFLLFCNALGLIGQRAATADVNFTFAMSIMIFFVIQLSGIRSRGIKGYLKHYAEPFAMMIPIKILEEIVFPISLAFRLFGNILAGFIIYELFMHLMATVSSNLHLPIPLLQIGSPLPVNLFFDIFEPVLQAFVFSMLAMVFISRAVLIRDQK